MRRELLVTVALVACVPGEGTSAGATSTGTAATTDATTSTSTGAPTSTTSSGGATTGATTGESTGESTGASTTTTGEPVLGCNGHAALCDRRYDEVVYAATHNSYSARDAGFSPLVANQQRTVAVQLQEGIRALLLDVTIHEGETALCHGPCSFGKTPHIEVLADIAAFLADNPREIVTILYEDSASPAAIEADYVALGLVDKVFVYEGGPFPTLAEMIAADTRLVVTAENGGPPPPWFHHLWDVAWDTPYSYKSADEFSCAPNRGDPDNPLFLVNHWVNNELDLPSEMNAKAVNTFEVLHARALECMQASGDLPNFIAVDFYEQGDLLAVVDALNGV